VYPKKLILSAVPIVEPNERKSTSAKYSEKSIN
jgi:hypothetical protein